MYGEKENSFILYNISQKYAEYLGHRFDQESFIFAERKANDNDENKIEFSLYSKQISEKDEELARKHPSLLQYRLIDTTTNVQTTNLDDDMTVIGKNFSFRIPFGLFSGNIDAINKMVEERVEKSPAYGELFESKLNKSINKDIPFRIQREIRASLWSDKYYN